MRRHRRDINPWIVGAIILIILAASIAWTKFLWTECRKDPDHTFWHCVQVMDS